MMGDSQILVVEDDQDTCSNLADILNDLGYEMDVAYRGWDVLDLVKQMPYRLALLDLRLPCMDGVELFDRIRQVRNDVRAVIVTAFATADTDETAIAKGIQRVLSKPVNFDELLPLVRKYAGDPV